MQIRRGVAAGGVIVAMALVGIVPHAGAITKAKKPAPVTCTAISGINDSGETLTLSGCSGATGGSGTAAGPFFAPTVITWASGGQTTVTFAPKPGTTKGCPAGDFSAKLRRGRVTSSTIAGTTGGFHVSFCVSQDDGEMSLDPGTVMKF
jgi:hypothetical protein